MNNIDYHQAKKQARLYFWLIVSEQISELQQILNNKELRYIQSFVTLIREFGDSWSQEFTKLITNETDNLFQQLAKSRQIWTKNIVIFRSCKGKIESDILAVPLIANFDLVPYSTSACYSTNEHSVKINNPNELMKIGEFVIDKKIRITKCFPKYDFSVYSPKTLIDKMAKGRQIKENCQNWNFTYFSKVMVEFMKNKNNNSNINEAPMA